MLLEDQFGHSGFEQKSAEDAFGFQSAIENSDATSSQPPELSTRHTVHVVAEQALQRAAMARMIFASGHHAEVYNDAAELVAHHPTAGIVLVHESGKLGAAVVCQALAKNGLWLPVIGFGVEVDACRIVAGMKAGAMDYLVGLISPPTMLTKLQDCAKEAEAVSEIRGRRADARSVLTKLSDRERQVLDLLAAGLSNKEMARDLGISPRTVEIHRMKMMGKIGASSSAYAVRMRIEALEG
jgi:two-component system, LuxR family, response regulator FixJ